MQVFRSVAIASEPVIRPVSARTLRQWCAPEVILAVTNLTDESVILPHTIMQAKPSHAKIVLAHVVRPVLGSNVKSQCRNPAFDRTTSRLKEPRIILERMAQHLRWLGFVCEPILLTGRPEVEIPFAARSCCVDRVILGFEEGPDLASAGSLTITEQILSKMDVPTCVIGRNVGLPSGNGHLAKRITLGASLQSDCDVPLSFACRLAQEMRAQLTLLHVIGQENKAEGTSSRTPAEIASKLPVPTWREAELLCPTEITIRHGDTAGEILKYSDLERPNLIILCSPGNLDSGKGWRASVSYQVITSAKCPVFVLKKEPERPGLGSADDMLLEKVPAYRESLTVVTRKEDFM